MHTVHILASVLSFYVYVYDLATISRDGAGPFTFVLTDVLNVLLGQTNH